MTAHTPGPWFHFHGNGRWWVGTRRSTMNVAKITEENGVETARLIAAAPDLLKALEEIANGDGIYGAQAHEYKQIAHAAIAKAKGDGQ